MVDGRNNVYLHEGPDERTYVTCRNCERAGMVPTVGYVPGRLQPFQVADVFAHAAWLLNALKQHGEKCCCMTLDNGLKLVCQMCAVEALLAKARGEA
jgi:hypothetical protein